MKNMCCGLSVVFKITTRRSTIDVRKKSDLSRKNRTTGSPGHVRKIWDRPWPGYLSWYHFSIEHDIAHELQSFVKMAARATHRSMTPKSLTPTAPSCIDDSWRSTTLSPPKKLTSSTASLEWCHVHFIRDLYSTFIRWVSGPSKNSME